MNIYICKVENIDDNEVIIKVAATEEAAYEYLANRMYNNMVFTLDNINDPNIAAEIKQIEECIKVGNLSSRIKAINIYNELAINECSSVSYSVMKDTLLGNLGAIPSGKGCTCKQCKDHNPYAEANQPDGSFICRACRLWNS